MVQVLHQVVRRHLPALKAEWGRHLRDQPATTAMAHPEILAHLMDETLRQFGALLRAPSAAHWRVLQAGRESTFQSHSLCRCGLNPLLAYFLTGGQALDDTLATPAGLSDAERERLRLAWHALAQREIDLLCANCCRNCALEPAADTGR